MGSGAFIYLALNTTVGILKGLTRQNGPLHGGETLSMSIAQVLQQLEGT